MSRISEGLQLRVKDLDFDHGTIIVREGKGSKDRALINKLTTTLINMIEELEPDEARKALKLLSKGGLLALMPLVFNEQKLYSFIGFSQQSIQTLMMLDALPEEKRKEILSKYGIHEQESVVVPSQEPQEVKKAV